MAQVRGEADALALKMRHHDARLHSSRMPTGDVAPVLFEMLEQARVEALGTRGMAGASENIAAALEDKFRREGLHRVNDRTEATMPDVLLPLARQAFTGEAPPPAAQRVCELWEPLLKEKIGKDLEVLRSCLTDLNAIISTDITRDRLIESITSNSYRCCINDPV